MLLLKYLHNNSINMFSIVEPKHELPSLKLLSCTNIHRPSISKTNFVILFIECPLNISTREKNHDYFPRENQVPPSPPHRIRNRGHQGSLDRKCSNDGARLIDANTGRNFVVKRQLFLIPRMCFLVFDR